MKNKNLKKIHLEQVFGKTIKLKLIIEEIEECEFDESGSIINEYCYLAEYYDDIVLAGIYQYDELKLGFRDF